MTKQEEIREIIDSTIKASHNAGRLGLRIEDVLEPLRYNCIMTLHSQGTVIKVVKECSLNSQPVEPLIEEK